jgi:hypothetical protein
MFDIYLEMRRKSLIRTTGARNHLYSFTWKNSQEIYFSKCRFLIILHVKRYEKKEKSTGALYEEASYV